MGNFPFFLSRKRRKLKVAGSNPVRGIKLKF